MPVYTYQCDDCGVRFDARQKFSDPAVEECPECGGHVHRVPQPVGIVFKGSGWYATDSRGKNNLAVSGTKKDVSDSASGDSAKSDTKTESKANAKSETSTPPASSSDSSTSSTASKNA